MCRVRRTNDLIHKVKITISSNCFWKFLMWLFRFIWLPTMFPPCQQSPGELFTESRTHRIFRRILRTQCRSRYELFTETFARRTVRKYCVNLRLVGRCRTNDILRKYITTHPNSVIISTHLIDILAILTHGQLCKHKTLRHRWRRLAFTSLLSK